MNIYVVMGSTGEYSDERRWTVIAYFDKVKAQEHVINADRRAKEIFVEYKGDWVEYKEIPPNANEFDPDMVMDYTGTIYWISAVPIADKLS